MIRNPESKTYISAFAGITKCEIYFLEMALVYTFGPSESLEQTIGQEIRNATYVMKIFDKIAEVIETDRANGASEQDMGTGGKNLLWITFPVSQMRLEALKL